MYAIRNRALLKKDILFIINPISGGKKKHQLPDFIHLYLDHAKFRASYRFTTHVGNAAEIAESAVAGNFAVIVAVGGDGTINEVASKVMGSNKVLGIIPFGSGNGLARSLHIPMQSKKAIQVINRFQEERIDCARLNEHYFFNMAGVGFDAHISAEFAKHTRRGLFGYLQMGLKEMLNYRTRKYELQIDGEHFIKDAYVISIANSAQYGNNVYISPRSSLKDGVLEVCIIKQFPLYKLPILAYQMLCKQTDHSNLVEIIAAKTIKIIRRHAEAVHLDGEPFLMEKELNISIIPNSLRVISN